MVLYFSTALLTSQLALPPYPADPMPQGAHLYRLGSHRTWMRVLWVSYPSRCAILNKIQLLNRRI